MHKSPARDSISPSTLCGTGSAAAIALAKTGIGELRRLRVDAAGNRVTLSGAVGSYYHKQLAQETLRTAVAGISVQNNVAVSG